MQCTECNAQLQPDERKCAFCGAATPLAVREAEEARRQVRDVEQQRRAVLDRAQKQAGMQALVWSGVGLMFCFFFPFPSVVGAVLALRARSVARQAGAVPPVSATVALVLSCLSAVLFAVFVVAVIVSNSQNAAEREQLRARLTTSAAQTTLDQATACNLVQLHLLEHGFERISGVNMGHFECDGKLTQDGDRAVLEDVHFTFSTEQVRATQQACLRKGERWFVDRLATTCP